MSAPAIVPTFEQLRELYLLRAWVNPPPVDVLKDGGANTALINALLRNDISTLDELHPLYSAIRDRLVDGRMRQATWTERSGWLSAPIDGMGAGKAERIVEVYEAWGARHPAQAAAVAANAERRVSYRAKFALTEYLRNGKTVGAVARMLGVTPERARQNLRAVGLTAELRHLHEINQAWVRHWDSQPCSARDHDGVGPCEGHHELLQTTLWGTPAGPYEVICTRHADTEPRGTR